MNYAIATPIQYTLLNHVSNKTDLANQLIAVFEAVGWTVHATITGGKTLLGASPEGYEVLLDVFADSGSNGVLLQMHSAIGGPSATVAPFLAYDASYSWQIIAHPCGAAISAPGKGFVPSTLGAVGSAAFLGIPFIGSNCGVTGNPVTEAWFVFGDVAPVGVATNPRLNIDVGNPAHPTVLQGCLNGALSLVAPANAWNAMQILRFSSAAPDGSNSHPYWYGEQDFLYPAFIAWPPAADEAINIIGQVYNAAVRSSPSPVDALRTWDGYNWMAYTYNYFLGTVWVLRGNAGGKQNVTY